MKTFVGNGVNGDFRGLSQFYIHDVGFIHPHFGGDDRKIGHRHQRAARRILNTHHYRLAFMHRQIGDRALEGRDVSGLAQLVVGAGEHGLRLLDVSAGRFSLRFGLRQPRFRLRQSSFRAFIGHLPGVVICLGDERVFVETLRALPIQPLLRGVSARPVQICDRGSFRRNGSLLVRAAGAQRCPLRRHIRRRLHALQLRQHLPLLHLLAFFHIQLDDLAEGVGPNVHVGLGLDFPRGGHHRSQVLRLHRADLHRHHALLVMDYGESNQRRQYHHDAGNDRYLFPIHCFSL